MAYIALKEARESLLMLILRSLIEVTERTFERKLRDNREKSEFGWGQAPRSSIFWKLTAGLESEIKKTYRQSLGGTFFRSGVRHALKEETSCKNSTLARGF